MSESSENATWGAPRIRAELALLGYEVSQATVAKYMRRRAGPPSQTWKTFLKNHMAQTAAIDFFVVPTVTFRLLYGFVVLRHERREIVHFAVTDHPNAAWTAAGVPSRVSQLEGFSSSWSSLLPPSTEIVKQTLPLAGDVGILLRVTGREKLEIGVAADVREKPHDLPERQIGLGAGDPDTP